MSTVFGLATLVVLGLATLAFLGFATLVFLGTATLGGGGALPVATLTDLSAMVFSAVSYSFS